jgi:hypothetical protein
MDLKDPELRRTEHGHMSFATRLTADEVWLRRAPKGPGTWRGSIRGVGLAERGSLD